MAKTGAVINVKKPQFMSQVKLATSLISLQNVAMTTLFFVSVAHAMATIT
ncbi:2-keto-3-deoxy-D-manno-octulosonate-8-phosphate synthase [Vibrio variabilis]|uniref:2-keto-3-deoxy-D-manno-octulosonate-8-phosphate synthase n=1 Tax=Vibrio variabilis TaxID=990271 RepID=A0ABQ0JQK3_9VIBR|nr:2-keto-3-deoxy-D-manno-octulosonate-8-phosphate synthase [Vibrio variabilis]